MGSRGPGAVHYFTIVGGLAGPRNASTVGSVGSHSLNGQSLKDREQHESSAMGVLEVGWEIVGVHAIDC